jgi:hypothetical protein
MLLHNLPTFSWGIVTAILGLEKGGELALASWPSISKLMKEDW